VVPLAIATGAGAEMRQSLGTAVFFGMLGVTLFGLFFTPTFYTVVQSLSTRLSRVGQHPSGSTVATSMPDGTDPVG
jgi:Cu/Ag efflux pump CusA